MREAEAWLISEEVKEVELHVWEFNKSAIKLYKDLNYETLGRKMAKKLFSYFGGESKELGHYENIDRR